MAYQIYQIIRDSNTNSSIYGTYVKSIADEIESKVPGITLESITTDTTSTYDAIYSIEGMTECKLRIFNSSSTMKIRIGNDVNYSGSSSENYYYGTSGSTYNSSYPLDIEIIVSDNMYFLNIIFPGSSNLYYAKYAFGLLTSKIDGSKIEVRLSGSSGKVMKNGNGDKNINFNCPSIGISQRVLLASNKACLLEGSLYSNSIDARMAPYAINGHSIYVVYYKPYYFIDYIITDGVDYFFIFYADSPISYAFRLT